MGETRKLAAILVSDVVGYSRLAGADEDRTLARLRRLRSDLIDPAIAAHHGRIVKRTGDGASASQFDPFFLRQFNALPRRSAFGPRGMTDGILHLVFASRRGMLPGVRAVIDFVAAALKSSAVP